MGSQESVLAHFIIVQRSPKYTVLLKGFNLTNIAALLTHSATSELSRSQKMHIHSATLKRTGCNLKAVSKLARNII